MADRRTGAVGYRPIEDTDPHKRRSAELARGHTLDVHAGYHMFGTGGVSAGNFVVNDPDRPGKVLNPYPECEVGVCEGRCGRRNVLRRPVVDVDPDTGLETVVRLCDACLLNDQL